MDQAAPQYNIRFTGDAVITLPRKSQISLAFTLKLRPSYLQCCLSAAT